MIISRAPTIRAYSSFRHNVAIMLSSNPLVAEIMVQSRFRYSCFIDNFLNSGSLHIPAGQTFQSRIYDCYHDFFVSMIVLYLTVRYTVKLYTERYTTHRTSSES
jgi:hypothetical protein